MHYHLEWSEITYQTSEKTKPLPEQGRSHRAGLPQKTARTHSWRPEKRENFRSGGPWFQLTASLNVTYLHVSFTRNVVFEVFHGAHQEGNVAGQHLEKRTHLWLELIWATTSSNIGVVNQIFFSFTQPHFIPMLYYFISSFKHKNQKNVWAALFLTIKWDSNSHQQALKMTKKNT